MVIARKGGPDSGSTVLSIDALRHIVAAEATGSRSAAKTSISLFYQRAPKRLESARLAQVLLRDA